MKIQEKIINEINHRFYRHALGDFDEQSIYNFVTNYLIHHGNIIPDNFDFAVYDNGDYYDIKAMNKESEIFLNQNFTSNLK